MFRPPASAHGGRARAFRRSDRRRWRRFSPNRAEKPRGGGFTRVCTQNFVYKKSPARKILAGDGGERLPPAKQGQSTKSPEMPSKSARPDQRRAKRDSQSQTASRLAGNGLSNVVTLSVRPVGVRSSRAGDVVQIMPPAVRANVVNFARAAHSAHVKFAIRGAFIG